DGLRATCLECERLVEDLSPVVFTDGGEFERSGLEVSSGAVDLLGYGEHARVEAVDELDLGGISHEYGGYPVARFGDVVTHDRHMLSATVVGLTDHASGVLWDRAFRSGERVPVGERELQRRTVVPEHRVAHE